jgi:hypothetical protein
MLQDSVVLGLLDTTQQLGDERVAARLRDLTLSWSRQGYHGIIIEDDRVESILDSACQAGFKHCFIQGYGRIIHDEHNHNSWQTDFQEALAHWIEQHGFFVTGLLVGSDAEGWGLDPTCLLVNLEDYARLGRPSFDLDLATATPPIRPTAGPRTLRLTSSPAWLSLSDERDLAWRELPGCGFIDVSLQHGKRVYHFGDSLLRNLIDLYPPDRTAREQFARFLGQGIYQYHAASPELTAGQRRFLDGVQSAALAATRGVFPLNFESYDDVVGTPEDFAGAVSTLYSVAAGLKPNMLLQAHGFDAHTRVVFFDSSLKALEFRRLLLREWDGLDYPRFVRSAFGQLPVRETFNHLWSSLSPDELDGGDLEQLWERELAQWGGADVLKSHWEVYRRLRHEFVYCDILTDPYKLFARLTDEPDAVIWWNNAFFTVHGNWFYSIEERRRRYSNWIRGLEARCPRAALYGADYNNGSVNALRAEMYVDQYRRNGGDCLTPFRMQRCPLRS